MINGGDLIVASVTQGLNCLGEYMRGEEDWRVGGGNIGDRSGVTMGASSRRKGRGEDYERRRGVRRGGEGMR